MSDTQQNLKEKSPNLENPFLFRSDSIKEEFYCTGGINPSAMTNSEYMDAFNAHNCSPTVLIPGIGGSKLVVKIDCETLRKENPDLFSSCGWNKCYFEDIMDHLHPELVEVPEKEYLIWMPVIFGPFGFYNPIKVGFDQNQCFQGIFGLKHSHNGEKLIFED